MKIQNISVIAILLLFTVQLQAQDAQEIIRKVQSKYDNISDAKATFTQTVKGSGGKETPHQA